MSLPPLRFAINDTVAVYLDHFPDLAAWLHTAGYELPSTTMTWQEFTPQPEALLSTIASSLSHPHWEETTEWSQESLTDLVHHLIDVHHAYLRAELPRLQHLWSLLARDHHHLSDDHERFATFAAALIRHLDQEERELFPLCLAIDQTRFGLTLPPSVLLRTKLHHLDTDHIDRQADLAALLQHQPLLLAIDDPRAQALAAGSEALARDLSVHADEETAILMPGVTHLHDLLDTRLNRRQSTPH